jgi:hypothetical protein
MDARLLEILAKRRKQVEEELNDNPSAPCPSGRPSSLDEGHLARDMTPTSACSSSCEDSTDVDATSGNELGGKLPSDSDTYYACAGHGLIFLIITDKM